MTTEQWAWRSMRADDIPSVADISDAVHGARYTERPEIFAERLRLYPAGCFVLARGRAIGGYLVTHPWRRGHAPALDRLVGALPDPADVYYLHDIALLPSARGGGAGAAAVALVLDRAATAGFGEVALTAINGADRYWATQGFVCVQDTGGPGSYGADSHYMRRLL